MTQPTDTPNERVFTSYADGEPGHHSSSLTIQHHVATARPHLASYAEDSRIQSVEFISGLALQATDPAVFDAFAAACTEAARRLRARAASDSTGTEADR